MIFAGSHDSSVGTVPRPVPADKQWHPVLDSVNQINPTLCESITEKVVT